MQTELKYTARFPESITFVMSLWSETRKRRQSKFSASTSLTETTATVEYIYVQMVKMFKFSASTSLAETTATVEYIYVQMVKMFKFSLTMYMKILQKDIV